MEALQRLRRCGTDETTPINRNNGANGGYFVCPASSGSAEFTRALERQEHRPLTRQKPGPKKRSESAEEQAIFSFDPF